ncbi:MAG: aminoacyl-tRNA hydrolase [Oscillospiraceae bacterium]|nr:aminoacyl-tRNA hydrolase [Oscillospiraceae bacterium]
MSFFQKASPGGISWLIVGLGNPDKKYEKTRHNAGFMAVDEIASSVSADISKKKFDALIADANIAGERVLLMKPQTYMNLSGVAVEKAASFYKIPPERIIVIFDDISLPVGKLRIRRKGSHGGHNGIRSIIDYLHSDNFPRVKIGVGEKPRPEYDLADWVLSTFTKDELAGIHDVAGRCTDIVEMIIKGLFDRAMNKYNS